MSALFRLYVAGSAPNSLTARSAIDRLRSSLAPEAREAFEVEIIDVFESPDRAAEDGILVTPTLVRVAPEPRRTLVGSLSDGDRLRALLEERP